MPFAVDKSCDLGVAPFRQLWDVVFRKSKHVGHDHLRQRARKILNKVDYRTVCKAIDQPVGTILNHRGMTACPRTYPGVREFLAVASVECMIGSESHHRGEHCINRRQTFAFGFGSLELFYCLMQAGRKTFGVFHYPLDVLVFGEQITIGARVSAFARDAHHGLVLM